MEFLIPIVAIGGFFAFAISLSPVGRAFADRLRHGPQPRAGTGDETLELADSVDALRREVAELAERVDFTERLLGQQQAGALGKPRS
jgi:hypothetical protein